MEVWSTGKAENYVPHRLEAQAYTSVEEGELQWIDVRLFWSPDTAQNAFLVIKAHHRTPFVVIPELVKDYRIEAWLEGAWKTLYRETDNRKRTRRHTLDKSVTTDRLRLVVESTNGGAYAEVVEIRAYGELR
ncbi:hypothetical protein PAT3040_05264 [Paenibacillus agaridevorans]|uniref:F5/8 type C domain-containing protein n=1 Tax=Paenibacillus agaridevorans TaxID=171404 RepID=A0A2R5F3F4_9BACL|nr:hypothetical protein PAT3040_05264 [Paenibacillus agaridevorans]